MTKAWFLIIVLGTGDATARVASQEYSLAQCEAQGRLVQEVHQSHPPPRPPFKWACRCIEYDERQLRYCDAMS